MTPSVKVTFMNAYAQENQHCKNNDWSQKELAVRKYNRYIKDYLRCI